MFHLVSNVPKWFFKQISFQILRFFHSGLSVSSSSGSTSAKTVFGWVLENIKKIKIMVRLQYFIRNYIRQALDTKKIDTYRHFQKRAYQAWPFFIFDNNLSTNLRTEETHSSQTNKHNKHTRLTSIISSLAYNEYLYISWTKLRQNWGTNTFNSTLEKQSHWPPHSITFWKETSILIHCRTTTVSKWKQNS